ncbi:MAG: hypothetical protein BWY82_02495 [Verrucomicrobia bacterium ADurb.Bin474]|nr:MAG: hypothetical protein BWY82_02495 [Verrucomicrobia bacterium ADurb.Bin474]
MCQRRDVFNGALAGMQEFESGQNGLQGSTVQTGVAENVVDQLELAFRSIDNGVQELAVVFVLHSIIQNQVRKTKDRVQRRPHFMAHYRKELILCPACTFSGFLLFVEFGDHSVPHSQGLLVAVDVNSVPDKQLQLSTRIVDGSDDVAEPTVVAILSHDPDFVGRLGLAGFNR